MRTPTLNAAPVSLRFPLGILLAGLLLSGCVSTTTQNAQRAYGTYWGYGVTSPGASGMRLIWITPSQTVCETVRRQDERGAPSFGVWRVLQDLGGGDSATMDFDSRCQVTDLFPGATATAVYYPPQSMSVTNERVGYLIAPTPEVCARLGYVIRPCFPVMMRSGIALGR